MEKPNIKIETRCVHGSKGFDPVTGAVSFPIYQSATFRHPGLNQSTGYDYSRLQNPTREELENTVAALEGADWGFAFSTGMAAITAMMELFQRGDHIVISDDIYGGTYRLFEEIYSKHGIEFTYVDSSKTSEVQGAIRPNTRAVFIETPSNPMMKVTDIKAVTEISRIAGLLTIVDNTFLTPYYQRPLELGADLVIHSGTKYLGGHNDTLAGFIIAKDAAIAEKLQFVQKSTGAVLSPFDSWLVLRGIKTLGVRLDKQQANAMEVSKWLETCSNVEKVYYIGLENHEGYDISKSQATGFGAMISFTVTSPDLVEQILARVKVVTFAESLGGVESLITYPAVQTHAAIPKEIRDMLGVNDRLLRLSVGIEAAGDIIADLAQAIG
jgi:cystathionine gamma-synthase